MPPYDPDSQLDASSLFRLEEATGMDVMIPIVLQLGQFNTNLHFILEAAGIKGVTKQAGYELMAVVGKLSSLGLFSCEELEVLIRKFLKTMKPKTWRTCTIFHTECPGNGGGS